MRQLHTLTYVISSIALLFCVTAKAQDETVSEIKNDSIKIEQKYGLRIGGDLSKLVRSFLDDDYKGFELNGDYRLTKNWYVAGEIGTEEKNTSNDFLNTTATGSYFKAGFDYNMYTNWLDMENMIYAGFRGGFSTFSQQLNSYTIYAQDQFWTPQFSSNNAVKFNGLSAIWVELIIGIKAEILNNLFIGINAQLKGLVSQDEPDNFENLYIPGFNKTYDSSGIGVGYGYTISYLIPIFKKDK